ncbi:hypothetical protein H4V99_000553 [Cryobacterium sp. CG_9.6]|nr:hypothetical protein [Cryobacterium sp. CG_9.6]
MVLKSFPRQLKVTQSGRSASVVTNIRARPSSLLMIMVVEACTVPFVLAVACSKTRMALMVAARLPSVTALYCTSAMIILRVAPGTVTRWVAGVTKTTANAAHHRTDARSTLHLSGELAGRCRIFPRPPRLLNVKSAPGSLIPQRRHAVQA